MKFSYLCATSCEFYSIFRESNLSGKLLKGMKNNQIFACGDLFCSGADFIAGAQPQMKMAYLAYLQPTPLQF